jgi:anti-sigma factor RsiW
MEPEAIHELTAAYALNALDPGEEDAYEEHLRRCDHCRAELAELQEAAAALAFAAEGPAPPPALRERILERAAAERPNVVPLTSRRRWVAPALGAIAAVAAGVAIGIGVWASSLHGSLDSQKRLAESQAQVIALFSGRVQQVPVAGADGTLVVDRKGDGALVLSGLAPAPAGKTYEAWVIVGDEARPAGTFEGGGDTSVHRLTRLVPPGAVVALTVEPDGGVEQPTTTPFASTPAI